MRKTGGGEHSSKGRRNWERVHADAWEVREKGSGENWEGRWWEW